MGKYIELQLLILDIFVKYSSHLSPQTDISNERNYARESGRKEKQMED